KRKYQWVKIQGFLDQGVVPEDTEMRGPLHQGLRTLEEHRGVHPLAGALDLLATNTDIVYIGDAGLSENVQEQFASLQK
ncbi:MupG family TIM beta-alpha barrel fold protein, partial [Enterococcus faecium]